jgi:hypothetical protein
MPAWKIDAEHCCPHGLKVFLVDGKHVRDTYDSDFCQGGNGFAYTFVPKDEIWIDGAIGENEWHLIEFHECGEVELMRKGMSYDQAHDEIKAQEDRIRHSLRRRESIAEPVSRQEALKMVTLLRPVADYLHNHCSDQSLETTLRVVIMRLKHVP